MSGSDGLPPGGTKLADAPAHVRAELEAYVEKCLSAIPARDGEGLVSRCARLDFNRFINGVREHDHLVLVLDVLYERLQRAMVGGDAWDAVDRAGTFAKIEKIREKLVKQMARAAAASAIYAVPPKGQIVGHVWDFSPSDPLEAWEKLSPEALRRKFDALEAEPGADEDLALLKEKMGIKVEPRK